MTSAILALALCGGLPRHCSNDGCPMCGCNSYWHGRGYLYTPQEKCFGSWYLQPEFGGNCNDRFQLTPAPHQGYYYFHHCGGDRFARERFRGHPVFERTAQFCERWDQNSFDPNYDTLPIDAFLPILHRIFARPPFGASNGVAA